MSAARELATTKLPAQVSLAAAGDLQLVLPVYEQQVTAIGYHSVDDDDLIALTPFGHQVNGSLISRGLGEVFPTDGPQYFVLSEGGKLGSALRSMDVGAPAGTVVYSPVDGVIAGIKTYQLKGECTDVEVKIQPRSQTRLLVVLTHLDNPQASLGQPVRAGVSRIGSVRALDACMAQPLGNYTYDNGNHLQVQVENIQ